MAFGDFAFMGCGPDDTMLTVGVELKTVADFVGSMHSGRLTGYQLPGLLETYPRVYVIVQGTYRARRGSGILEVPAGRRWRPLSLGARPVFWSDVEKFITGLEELGVRVWRTRTAPDTAQVLGHALYPFWQKPYDTHQSLQAGFLPAAPAALVPEAEARARLRRVCVSLKTGIGWGRSKAVAAHFDSIFDFVTATPSAWAGIPGVGPGIVAQTQDALHERIGTSAAPAGGVPARRGAVAGNARHPRVRAHRELDTGDRAE